MKAKNIRAASINNSYCFERAECANVLVDEKHKWFSNLGLYVY